MYWFGSRYNYDNRDPNYQWFKQSRHLFLSYISLEESNPAL